MKETMDKKESIAKESTVTSESRRDFIKGTATTAAALAGAALVGGAINTSSAEAASQAVDEKTTPLPTFGPSHPGVGGFPVGRAAGVLPPVFFWLDGRLRPVGSDPHLCGSLQGAGPGAVTAADAGRALDCVLLHCATGSV